MKKKFWVQTALDNWAIENRPQTTDQETLYRAVFNALLWVYNNGNLRTDEEMHKKIATLQNEIEMYQRSGYNLFEIKINEKIIKVLKELL